MELTWYHYLAAALGGAMAGAINTLAGNGSAITLTILTELIGLPGNAANATNRIGILAQSIGGMSAFYRHGKLRLSRSWLIMVFMLFVILVKPERWLRETDPDRKLPLWASVPFFLALGFYGGFIQMGMGIFFLGVMVLAARYSLIDSNAVKITVTGIYTFLAVVIFQFQGMVHWPAGLAMALGQAAGGYFTAHYAADHPKANIWAHRLLVFVVIASILQLFDLPARVLGWNR